MAQLAPLDESAWSEFSARVLAAQPVPAAAAAAPGAGSSAYAGRLQQLAGKLARVLRGRLEAGSGGDGSGAAAAAPEDGAAPAAEQLLPVDSSALPSVQLDALAAAAAERALLLSQDSTKGARLRKKKALTDLLAALGEAGASKRASAVPPDDRAPSDWFTLPPPALEGSTLMSGAIAGGSGLAVLAPERQQLSDLAWAKADVYYWRCIARLQKLWEAAKQPHKDVAPYEVGGCAAAACPGSCCRRDPGCASCCLPLLGPSAVSWGFHPHCTAPDARSWASIRLGTPPRTWRGAR